MHRATGVSALTCCRLLGMTPQAERKHRLFVYKQFVQTVPVPGSYQTRV